MQKLQHSRLLPTIGLLLGALVWLANNGNPPTGRTGSPFDNNNSCNNCHNGGNFGGTVDVSGFPAVINPDVVYDITITLTSTSGSPTKAGFQLAVVDGSDNNCGDLKNITGAGTGTEMLSGREYIEHRNGRNFSGGTVTWDFQWQAPINGVSGNTIKAYFIGNFCNGNGGQGGDIAIKDNATFTFAGPPPIMASISSTTNPSCNGSNNGSATVEATGGNTPYTYLWTGGQTTQTAINLVAGTYTVTVTGASGSGTATAVATLTQPTQLGLTVSVAGIVTCVQNASATATATGGTPAYSYQWSNGETGNMAFFDQGGPYTVTATDANGCSKTVAVNIPSNLNSPIAIVATPPDLTCLVTQVQLNGSGSSTGPTFSYNWTASNGGNIVSGATTLFPTVNACGTYKLVVTNATNGCTSSASAVVACDALPPDATAMGGTLTCTILSVTLSGISLTPGATFSWTGPAITPTNQFQQNPVVNLAGTYTLTVTNPDNGCTKTASATVTSNTTPPTANATVSGNLTCANTSVQLNLTTNAPNALFWWTGPGNFSSSIANPSVGVAGDYIGMVTNTINGCTARDTVTVGQNTTPPGASAVADGQITCVNDTVALLGNSPAAPNVSFAWAGLNFSSQNQNALVDTAGTYTLTVTSTVNGCTSTAVATVTQNITPPFDSIVPPAHLNCNNASIQLNGTPSSQGPLFKYLWTVKNGGHIVSGDTTLTPTVDSIGKYFLRVTNIDNGCTALDSVTVVLSPPVTAAIASSVGVSCNGGSNGSATATGSGGNGLFTFQWNNGDSTSTINNLAAGTYIVTVNDGESCTATASVSITQPDALLANASATGETAAGANDGTATANPSGGTAGYTYLWSNNDTGQTISGLTPGAYSVVVTDANGCTAIQTVTVNSFGCSLAANMLATNVTCHGANNGVATVQVTSGAMPVSFLWSTGATTQSVANLSPGTYTVGLLDGNNCPAVLSVSIGEPPVLAANASATAVTANGATDGTATASPSGGTPGYTYLWSNNGTSQTITGLAPGLYTVIATDANGCTDQQTVTVFAFNCALTATISSVDVSCFGLSNGQATMAVNNGALPYTYHWSNGATTQTVTNLGIGSVSVTATDAAGCTVSQSAGISQPPLLIPTITEVHDVLCPQDMTGSIEVTVTGGVPPYSFGWPGGNVNSFGPGSYALTVTDGNGCTSSTSFIILSTDTLPPTINCPADINLCGADFVVYPSATAVDNCGVLGLPTLVSGPVSGSVFLEGNYVITFQASDASGNSSSCSFLINVNQVPDILLDSVFNDQGGQGVGAIYVTPVGGADYTFAWKKNGQPFAVTEDLTGLSEGSYRLTIVDQFGCETTLAPVTITNTVGISEPGIRGSVRLWPNPAQSAIHLEVIDLDVIAVSIVDLRGALVKEIALSELADAIEVGQLPAGAYCLKMMTASGRAWSLKFVRG